MALRRIDESLGEARLGFSNSLWWRRARARAVCGSSCRQGARPRCSKGEDNIGCGAEKREDDLSCAVDKGEDDLGNGAEEEHDLGRDAEKRDAFDHYAGRGCFRPLCGSWDNLGCDVGKDEDGLGCDVDKEKKISATMEEEDYGKGDALDHYVEKRDVFGHYMGAGIISAATWKKG